MHYGAVYIAAFTIELLFYRATLCISAVFAVCPSVCHVRVLNLDG